MTRFATLRNVLTLFRAEAVNHASPYDYACLDGFRDRIGFLYSDDDQWAPPAAAIRTAKAGLLVRCSPLTNPPCVLPCGTGLLRGAPRALPRRRPPRSEAREHSADEPRIA